MTDISTRQPANPNYLQGVHFRFTLKRAPNVMFFAQEVQIPDISIAVTEQAGPFARIKRPGQKMEFNPFVLNFKVDEDLKNYLEIYNWMVGIGFPDDFQDYAKLAKAGTTTGEGVFSDGTLSILNSSKSPNIVITFENMFPVSLSTTSLNMTNSDMDYVNGTVTFYYHRFRVEKLT